MFGVWCVATSADVRVCILQGIAVPRNGRVLQFSIFFIRGVSVWRVEWSFRNLILVPRIRNPLLPWVACPSNLTTTLRIYLLYLGVGAALCTHLPYPNFCFPCFTSGWIESHPEVEGRGGHKGVRVFGVLLLPRMYEFVFCKALLFRGTV